MKFWEDIVNKATLGSAKVQLKSSDLPTEIVNDFDVTDVQDQEENFLRLTTLAYQYRQAGAVPLNFQNVIQSEAQTEIKLYCSAQASAALKAILDEDHHAMLETWLTLCIEKDWCVQPEIIPALFDIAGKRKELRKFITSVSGERGVWLAELNPAWNFFSVITDPNVAWETGTPEERRTVLRDLRSQEPAQALDLLKTTWATEGVNEKVSFLQILEINLSNADGVWLESLNEKGQKVNAAIQELLKLIPESAIVQSYITILKEAVQIKTGKALLGMINKKAIEINESILFPESIFKTGIEKLSSTITVSDHQYILTQLMRSVPPAVWNEHLQTTTQEIISLFQKDKKISSYLTALVYGAIKFNDQSWIEALVEHGDEDVINNSILSLVAAVPVQERDRYARKYFKLMPREIIQLMTTHDREWSLELTQVILKFTANEVYTYSKNFYRQVVALMPVAILEVLDSYIPAEEQKKSYWKTQSDELTRLLFIKRQTLQSFIS